MSQRHSGYAAIPGDADAFATPEWVTHALMSVETFPDKIWEPAVGDGHMVNVLREYYPSTCSTGIGPVVNSKRDFLCQMYGPTKYVPKGVRSIITNPPYSNGKAEAFVRRALYYTHFDKGKVAMLLSANFDYAKGRRDLFADLPAFKAKYTLTRRIRWENLEQKKNGPSTNHAWFVFCWKNSAPPLAGYLP